MYSMFYVEYIHEIHYNNRAKEKNTCSLIYFKKHLLNFNTYSNLKRKKKPGKEIKGNLFSLKFRQVYSRAYRKHYINAERNIEIIPIKSKKIRKHAITAIIKYFTNSINKLNKIGNF